MLMWSINSVTVWTKQASSGYTVFGVSRNSYEGRTILHGRLRTAR